MMRSRGFTLIEVTIALAIFAIAAVVVSQSFLSGLLSLSRFDFDDTREELTQHMYQSILRPLSEASAGTVKNTDGVREMLNYGTVKWSADVEGTDIKSLFKVTIALDFIDEKLEAGADTRFVTETFYLYRPQWAKGSSELSVIDEV